MARLPRESRLSSFVLLLSLLFLFLVGRPLTRSFGFPLGFPLLFDETFLSFPLFFFALPPSRKATAKKDFSPSVSTIFSRHKTTSLLSYQRYLLQWRHVYSSRWLKSQRLTRWIMWPRSWTKIDRIKRRTCKRSLFFVIYEKKSGEYSTPLFIIYSLNPWLRPSIIRDKKKKERKRKMKGNTIWYCWLLGTR